MVFECRCRSNQTVTFVLVAFFPPQRLDVLLAHQNAGHQPHRGERGNGDDIGLHECL